MSHTQYPYLSWSLWRYGPVWYCLDMDRKLAAYKSRITYHDALRFLHSMFDRIQCDDCSLYFKRLLTVDCYVTCSYSLSPTSCFNADIMWISREKSILSINKHTFPLAWCGYQSIVPSHFIPSNFNNQLFIVGMMSRTYCYRLGWTRHVLGCLHASPFGSQQC